MVRLIGVVGNLRHNSSRVPATGIAIPLGRMPGLPGPARGGGLPGPRANTMVGNLLR